MTKKISYKIVGKYIKDLIFNIPNAKTFFLLSKNIENYKVNIDIRSKQIDKKIIEIQTSMSLEDFDKINTKIIFATIIEISYDEIEKKDIEKIILIDVPNEIYGELRKIFVSLFESSGFKNIKINESVDFQKLYNLRQIQ